MMKKISRLLSIIIISIIVLISITLIGPPLLGYRTYAVLSGSMAPHLQVGSIAYVKHVTPDDISVGDVITYTMAGNSSILVTHRVVDIDELKNEFITRGDANESVDGPVAFDRLVGKMFFHIPYLGFATVYLKTTQGIMVLAGVFIIILALTILPDILNNKN